MRKTIVEGILLCTIVTFSLLPFVACTKGQPYVQGTDGGVVEDTLSFGAEEDTLSLPYTDGADSVQEALPCAQAGEAAEESDTEEAEATSVWDKVKRLLRRMLEGLVRWIWHNSTSATSTEV